MLEGDATIGRAKLQISVTGSSVLQTSVFALQQTRWKQMCSHTHCSSTKSYTQIQGTNWQRSHLDADVSEHNITILTMQALFSAHQTRNCFAM